MENNLTNIASRLAQTVNLTKVEKLRRVHVEMKKTVKYQNVPLKVCITCGLPHDRQSIAKR